jgi:hypothetical protein
MNTTIQFLRDPKYQDTVVLFILAPAGIQYDSSDIGKNLFGSDPWTHEALLIDGLAPKARFRYSDISFHWTDFLDLAFRHVDHGLFYVPHKRTFKEIGKESLVKQNPDLYSFSLLKFICASRKGLAQLPTGETPVYAISGGVRRAAEPTKGPAVSKIGDFEQRGTSRMPANDPRSAADKLIETRLTLQSLLDAGWSANAVSKTTGITAMTIGSIKNGKSTQVSSRVYSAIRQMKANADAGRISPKSRGTSGIIKTDTAVARQPVRANSQKTVSSLPAPEPDGKTESLLKSQYVAVNGRQLKAMIDRLSILFVEAIDDLREIRRQISK